MNNACLTRETLTMYLPGLNYYYRAHQLQRSESKFWFSHLLFGLVFSRFRNASVMFSDNGKSLVIVIY